MQYYIKIFNKTTGELVGYYKETGMTCITKLPKGMKYFNNKADAIKAINEITKHNSQLLSKILTNMRVKD